MAHLTKARRNDLTGIAIKSDIISHSKRLCINKKWREDWYHMDGQKKEAHENTTDIEGTKLQTQRLDLMG